MPRFSTKGTLWFDIEVHITLYRTGWMSVRYNHPCWPLEWQVTRRMREYRIQAYEPCRGRIMIDQDSWDIWELTDTTLNVLGSIYGATGHIKLREGVYALIKLY